MNRYHSLVSMVLLALGLAACGDSDGNGATADAIDDAGSEASPEADVPVDAPPEADAQDAPADTAEPPETFNGVSCGPDLECRPPAAQCCADDSSFRCVADATGCPLALLCDGPEDCAGVCCMTVYSLSEGSVTCASTPTECLGRGTVSGVACRSAADCPGEDLACCPVTDGFDVKVCRSSSLCPP